MLSDRFEKPDRADTCHLRRVLRRVERDLDVALRSEVIDLVRLDQAQDMVQRRCVVQVTIMEEKLPVRDMRVLVDVIDARRVERGGPTDNSMDLVSLREKQLGQIRAVLPGDSGDQCS